MNTSVLNFKAVWNNYLVKLWLYMIKTHPKMFPWQLMRGHLRGQKIASLRHPVTGLFRLLLPPISKKHLLWTETCVLISLPRYSDSYFPTSGGVPSQGQLPQGFRGGRASVLLGQEAGRVAPEGWRETCGAAGCPWQWMCELVCKSRCLYSLCKFDYLLSF